MDLALQEGLIDLDTAAALRRLETLRNFAAHDQIKNVDRAKALDFLALADSVMVAIERGKPQRD
jgi:hypothetical protein